MRNLAVAFLASSWVFAFQANAEPRLNNCDWPANARNIVEPWSDYSRTFANGNIRIAHVDTDGEPACCSSHLLILAPDPKNELGGRSCNLLSDGGSGTGFQYLSVAGTTAKYDPAKGLLITVPVERYIDGQKSGKATITVRINQATGGVTIE